MPDDAVKLTGPFFTSGPKIIDEFVQESGEQLAQTIFDELQRRFDQDFVNPTGYYESRVRINNSQADIVINDQNTAYGPWLEGISSRNGQSRFKGYKMWQETKDWATTRATEGSDALFEAKYNKMLGGE